MLRYSIDKPYAEDNELTKPKAESLFLAARDGDLIQMRLILQDDVIGIADICLMEENSDESITATTLTEYLKACRRLGSPAIEGVKLLVEHGARISLETSSSSSDRGTSCTSAAMRMAMLYDMVEVVWYFLSQGTRCPTVHDGRSVEMIEMLILYGADVQDRSNSANDTLLFSSLYDQEKQREILEFALSHGVDINAVDRFGRTALNRATMHGNEPTVRYLCNKGANLDIQDEHGRTALGTAIYWYNDAFNYSGRGPPPHINKHETYRILRDEVYRRKMEFMCAIVSDPTGLGSYADGSKIPFNVLSRDLQDMIMKTLGYVEHPQSY
jgi:hypothetical protein